LSAIKLSFNPVRLSYLRKSESAMLIALQLVGVLLLVAAAIMCGDFVMSGIEEALEDPTLPESATKDR
jgi:hypothetical protein